MKIRKSFLAIGLTLALAAPSAACGSEQEYEYVTTDTVGDCDQGDWDTRTTDPESAQECDGKTGPDLDLDKPHKVKKSKKSPKTGNTKKDTKPKTGTNNKGGGAGSRGGRR